MTTPPQRLGKYEIHEELGRGAFATVYRALDITLNREAALKVLHPPLLTDPAFIARFQREAQTMAKLDHRHIAAVYEVGEAAGRVYIALYLARGPNLSAALAERGRFPWAQTLALLQPICEALDYAHGRGVVHRDLKPANILLDSERGPVITDFGFARLMGDSSVSLSLSGGILGTPAYIAPEVWELDASAPPADIYALGCITCELLTGETLFAGKTPMQAMRAHDQGPQFPPAWPEDAPPGIQAALSKALARDPAARYPSSAALWHALRDLEAQAQAARETAEQAAVAAQWRAETEAAMAAGEWRAAKMAAARWLALAPGDKAAQMAAQRVETALAEAARQQQEDAAAAARERERLEAEQLRALREAAQRQAAAAAAQRQQWEAEQAAPVQPAVYTPVVQRPAPPKAAERKAFPAWGWVLVAIVGLMGGLWGLSSLGNKPPAEPPVVEKTVVVTQEVVKVVTATPSPTVPTDSTITVTLIPTATASPITAPAPYPTPTITPTLVSATRPSTVVFTDEFNGTSLSSRWVQMTGVAASVSEGNLSIVSPPYQTRHPFIYLNYDPIPKDQGFEFEIRFRYIAVTGYGSGCGISNYDPRIEGNRSEGNFLAIWQDMNMPLSIFANVLHEGDTVMHRTYNNDLSWHTVKIIYTSDGQYDLFFDGVLVSSRPIRLENKAGLWFGNRQEVWPPGDWTGFEVDYIRIKSR